MSDKIFLYPQSSCSSCNIENKKISPNYKKSNLPSPNCEYPTLLNTYQRLYLDSKDVDNNETCGIVRKNLNSQVYTDKISSGYNLLPCNSPCNGTAYLSQDPRLYSTTLAEYLPLDTPPINGNVKLSNVYNQKLDNYGNGYCEYKDIRDGQIMYYVDETIKNAFFNPLFANEAKSIKVLYKDPMDSIKPEYTRISKTENPVTRCRDNYPCTSFIEDTQSFREDLLSYQMRKRNQQRWETLWE